MFYNDRSPLENMHCAKLYEILEQPSANVFKDLDKADAVIARQICIETILHTDMAFHQGAVKELELLYETRSRIFEMRRFDPTSVSTMLRNEYKMTVMNALVHSADVSNPCRPFHLTFDWAQRCLAEFFAQGDKEQERNIPVSFLNDRKNLNQPNSQVGFIEFMIAPLWFALTRIFPEIHEYSDNIVANIESWESHWTETTPTPGPDERAIVRGRVLKLQQTYAAQCLKERDNAAAL
eukprot:NODE_2681_length_894_cov_333.696067.p1 GENE.NODE_2681_length_894_cov_333.696067~~NODE_2681_length_894_cov_333.696067.p1  ORF type:complete len:259 (-),score=71.12 NODE_2681_length_894_cov_333.696067:118-828(-)